MRLFNRAPILALMAALAAAAGCELETRVIRDGWANFPADPSPEHQAWGGAEAPTWAVRLAHYRGRDSRRQARQLIQRLQREANVTDAWAVNSPHASTVYRGRFVDPSTSTARQTLAQTRQIELDGERPFADARLTSPHLAGEGDDGGDGGDPADLAHYPGYYSLQVGFFDDQHTSDRHRAAERWAGELRDEGHQAFYYHGPTRSMVTIGLFRYEQAFTAVDDPRGQGDKSRIDAYSGRVRALQQHFPYTLANGHEVYLEDEHGRRERQPTVLVRVH